MSELGVIINLCGKHASIHTGTDTSRDLAYQSVLVSSGPPSYVFAYMLVNHVRTKQFESADKRHYPFNYYTINRCKQLYIGTN